VRIILYTHSCTHICMHAILHVQSAERLREAPPKGGASSFINMLYYKHMSTAQLDKKIENIVEQKLLEFFGDPDEGLELKKSFVTELKKRMRSKQKTIPLSVVMKKYGLR